MVIRKVIKRWRQRNELSEQPKKNLNWIRREKQLHSDRTILGWQHQRNAFQPPRYRRNIQRSRKQIHRCSRGKRFVQTRQTPNTNSNVHWLLKAKRSASAFRNGKHRHQQRRRWSDGRLQRNSQRYVCKRYCQKDTSGIPSKAKRRTRSHPTTRLLQRQKHQPSSHRRRKRRDCAKDFQSLCIRLRLKKYRKNIKCWRNQIPRILSKAINRQEIRI